jgi:hypothetical protein
LFSAPFTTTEEGIMSDIAILTPKVRKVTGAKARAGFDFLLAPTRGGSIQPGCDRPG